MNIFQKKLSRVKIFWQRKKFPQFILLTGILLLLIVLLIFLVDYSIRVTEPERINLSNIYYIIASIISFWALSYILFSWLTGPKPAKKVELDRAIEAFDYFKLKNLTYDKWLFHLKNKEIDVFFVDEPLEKTICSSIKVK